MSKKTYIGIDMYTDEYGRKFRRVYEVGDGQPRCLGCLYETQPDSRQQPKSLAYRLREELNGR